MGADCRLLARGTRRQRHPCGRHHRHRRRRQSGGHRGRPRPGHADSAQHRIGPDPRRSEHERRGAHAHVCHQHRRRLGKSRQSPWRVLCGYASRDHHGRGGEPDLARHAGGDRSGSDYRGLNLNRSGSIASLATNEYSYWFPATGGASMSPRLIALFLVLAMLSPAAFAQKPIAIHAANLIDGVSAQPRHNVWIVIRGNRIVSVGDSAAPADANVIESGPDAPVIPGLIDPPPHLFLKEEPREGVGEAIHLLTPPASSGARPPPSSARRCLEQGFTTIRDVETEGAGYGDVGIKEAVNDGFIPGPRIFASTRAISVTGGYPLEGYNPDIVVPKGAQIGDGPVQLRRITRQQLENGADWIKVYMTHRSWVDKQGRLVSQPTLTVEELKAVVDEAHGQQRKVACPAYAGIPPRRAAA